MDPGNKQLVEFWEKRLVSTITGPEREQIALERSIPAFSEFSSEQIQPSTEHPRHSTDYSPIDFALDCEITARLDRFPQCCRGHAKMDGEYGRYGERVLRFDDGPEIALQCETCGWWRFGDLVGPE